MDENNEYASPRHLIYKKTEDLKETIAAIFEDSRERSLALTKLEECTLWLLRCNIK